MLVGVYFTYDGVPFTLSVTMLCLTDRNRLVDLFCCHTRWLCRAFAGDARSLSNTGLCTYTTYSDTRSQRSHTLSTTKRMVVPDVNVRMMPWQRFNCNRQRRDKIFKNLDHQLRFGVWSSFSIEFYGNYILSGQKIGGNAVKISFVSLLTLVSD